jgi:hypothetical protein
VVAATAALVVLAAPAALAASYSVGTTSDLPGTCPNPSAGTCSLRQLITYENNLTSIPNPTDTIVVPAGTYMLTLGQLVVNESVTIAGAGARSTQIDQETTSASARVFDIVGNPKVNARPTVLISGVAMAFGKADSTNGFFGGDVLNQANLTLSEDLIEDGQTTSGSGGGISNDGGTLTLTHSLVWNNSSTNPNGGGDSGGIQNYGDTSVGAGQLSIDNSTIADNTSALGGGIFSWCAGTNGACSSTGATNTTTITNSTIAFNNGGSRSTTGGGLLVSQGKISVQNSIVASNSVTNPLTGGQTASNCASSSPGVIASLGHNIETAADCGFTATGDLPNTDPGFLTGGLQFNGGNTETFALKGDSPAVDGIPSTAANCSGSDQRDVPRPQGTGCDIGAYELFQPVEGQQFTAVIGQVSASSATINWGDGTSSAAQIDPTTEQASGTHTYAEEGIYHATITWQNSDGVTQNTPVDVKVVDATLTSAGDSISATTGVSFSGAVATFTDADPSGTATDYAATINWGDGTASQGTVTLGSGTFQVIGSHIYARVGTYSTTVSIADAGGASTVAHGTATVTAPPTPVSTGAPTPVSTGAPTPVSTGAPPSVGGTTATFTGSVNPDGLPTTAFFQYTVDPKYTGGGSIAYTQSTPVQAVGSDFATHTVTASVTGLDPNATYHVRLVADNSAGTTFGPDVAFNTLKTAPPPPPALGKTFNVSLVSGVVLILVHGQLVPITELLQIPTNTVIAAVHGTITLTIAVPSAGAHDAAAKGKKKRLKTQTGTFGGAVFKITQARNGLATLTLVEGAAFMGAPTYATCKAHKAADATAAALSIKTLQLLHASAHGKFRTTGRYSAATVRGTKWTVADRCDGTLTHDITDSVVVNDFVHHKTIILHAGQSYIAKARK